MTFNKKILAGLVAFAAASSAQAVTVAANDGWTLGVSGQVNQFVTFVDDNTSANADTQGMANGLLPAFLSFDMKAPTMNGLDIAAHISFQPGTNNVSGNSFEQREVYFTVDGSFGQILAGKALGLYASHEILNEQTIYGVGIDTAALGGNASTTLGGIGLGYDYAAWRSQVRWTSNDMNGFKLALAAMQSAAADSRLAGLSGGMPTGGFLNNAAVADDLRYEADLSYAGAFDGGSYTAWLSYMTQDQDDLAEDKRAWAVGGTLKVGGFEAMASYSDAEGAADATDKLEWSQYIIQAGYRFAGTTLVSANYSKLEDDSKASTSTSYDPNNDEADRITVGVYHDVNSNLKLVAEYTKVENDDNSFDRDIFSLGGFVFF
jgi:predicted porin